MTSTAAYDRKPSVIWEMTRACDLACRNCPNPNHHSPSSLELWTYEAYKTIDEIASVHPSRFIISGGDPLRRKDIDQVVDYAGRRGLNPILSLSPTATADKETIRRLRRNGLTRVIVSLDDATAEAHDTLRDVHGAFRSTLHLVGTALSAGLEVEVSTLATRRDVEHLPMLHRRLADLGLSAWNLYLLVPLPGWSEAEIMTADEVEQLFGIVSEMRSTQALAIRVFEGPHERRYPIENASARRDRDWADFRGYVAMASEGSEEVIFITHSGEVRPSEFLPIPAGNVRYSPLSLIHRNGAIFKSLRDKTNLKGKCGRCEFRSICGGSRARAYAMTGDPFESDPFCVYEPGSLAIKAHGRAASC